MKSHHLPIFFLGLFLACSTEESQPCDAASVQLDVDGLSIASTCLGIKITFEPQVQVGEEWLKGDCASTSNNYECRYPEAGVLRVNASDGVVTSSFRAEAQLQLRGIRFRGQGNIPQANAWLSNGFQSWSQSGVLQIGRQTTDAELRRAIAQEGDPEVLREGHELSWWYSYAGSSTGPSVLMGTTEIKRWRSWVRVFAAPTGGEDLILELNHGGAEEELTIESGEEVKGEPWFITSGENVTNLLETYSTHITKRNHPSPVKAAPGWNSWYDIWDKVKAEDIIANASETETILKPLLPTDNSKLTIVVDDGWQQAWGIWDANEKFPEGMKALADRITQKGWRPGIWLAPLLVDPKSSIAKEHPEWLVAGASFLHPIHGDLKVLDVTHPEAAQHLQDFISKITNWGYQLLKIDFLFAGTFVGQRNQEGVLGLQAYAKALEFIRAAAGDKVELLAVGAPGLPSLPWVDAWRVGPDIAFEQTDVNWHFIPGQARNIASRWHLCLITLCDGDPILFRTLPEGEVNTGAWVASLAGGALFLSDNLTQLPSERHGFTLDRPKVELALGGRPAIPVDIYPDRAPEKLTSIVDDIFAKKTTHVVPKKWRLPEGQELLINLTETEMKVDDTQVPARTSILKP